jgi:hypothetical protein
MVITTCALLGFFLLIGLVADSHPEWGAVIFIPLGIGALALSRTVDRHGPSEP